MGENNNYKDILFDMQEKCQRINHPRKILNNTDPAFSFSKFILNFTTENISGYINEFDLKNKSLMTVGSSGDQLINAILYGCQDITHYDISPYSRYFIYLKLASILSLTREELLTFFSFHKNFIKENKHQFSNKTYKKVQDYLRFLDSESSEIWNVLFDSFKPSIISRALFFGIANKYKTIKFNPYLSDDISYEETRTKIKKANLRFLVGDLTKDNINETFDNIWLSNIADYYEARDNKIMFNNAIKSLNDNGRLLMCYLYDYTYKIEQRECLGELFQEYKPSIIEFSSCNQGTITDIPDAALIYHK